MRSLLPTSMLLLSLALAGCGNEHELIPFGSPVSGEETPSPNPDVPAPQVRLAGEEGGDDRDPRGEQGEDPERGDDPRGGGEEDDGAGCTLTQGYWKNHESAWPVASLTIGGMSYTASELDALLETATGGDASLILGHQLIAALLNVANGAGTPDEVDTALDSAQQWMAVNADADGMLPYDIDGGDAHSQATSLADTLADYNEGTIGPGHCD